MTEWNLVAKEFVASRGEMTVFLSWAGLPGQSQELQSAIIINPYDIEEAADAIKEALEMTPGRTKPENEANEDGDCKT